MIRTALIGLALLALTEISEAATFLVSSINNGGAGSLRQAILDANSLPGPDRIVFNISGTGVKRITLSAALPPITEPLVIDGTTQTGYAGTPLLEVHGGNVVSTPGLRIVCGNSTVRGLSIIRFLGQGIELSGPGGNVIAENFIGVGSDGVTARPNGAQGVWINYSGGNVIGGTNAADRNVISGNSSAGIHITGGGSNVVQGNLIGTRADGSSALANGGNGIVVSDSVRNRIGGSAPGEGNVISGNNASGVFLKDAGSTGNLVIGNLLGLAADGMTPVGNASDGVTINNAGANVIGGTAPGEGNTISGNKRSGIYIVGSGQFNRVQGNRIGTDRAGMVAAGNEYAGVTISRATNNLVGGETAAARNVISGNKADGVFITTNAALNVLTRNYIGVNASGTRAISNAYNGITISSAHENFIGPGNVISGNAFEGVSILNGAEGNRVESNFIGTDASGKTAAPNLRIGLSITRSPANSASGNVISGNGDAGIYIFGGAARANIIQGNRIGTDESGTTAIGNYREGIFLRQCVSNVIGGATATAGNIVSANGTWGISMTNVEHTLVQGNIIGTAVDRVTPLGNATRVTVQNSRFHTIELAPGCHGNRIGGAEPGAGNLIAYTPAQGGILYAGVRIRDGAAMNAVLGNEFLGNAGLPVDLGNYLETPNDTCDGDVGANDLQNFPMLTEVYAGNRTWILGQLDTRPNGLYLLEFFAAPATNASGDATIYLGSKTVASGAHCVQKFAADFLVTIPAGYKVSATATDANNNTSELSSSIAAQAGPQLAISLNAGSASAGTFELSWPSLLTGLVLKQTESLNPPVMWSAVSNATTAANGRISVQIPMLGPQRYFTLGLE